MSLKTVAITLSFDIFHEGHKDHIEKASKLGDKLIVIVDPTDLLLAKKHYEAIPQSSRLRLAGMVKWLNPNNEVVLSVDKDGTVAETLRLIKPTIFAKGGDRTPDNMPQNEIDMCKKIGCEIVYGIGDRLDSSQDIIRRCLTQLGVK